MSMEGVRSLQRTTVWSNVWSSLAQKGIPKRECQRSFEDRKSWGRFNGQDVSCYMSPHAYTSLLECPGTLGLVGVSSNSNGKQELTFWCRRASLTRCAKKETASTSFTIAVNVLKGRNGVVAQRLEGEGPFRQSHQGRPL